MKMDNPIPLWVLVWVRCGSIKGGDICAKGYRRTRWQSLLLIFHKIRRLIYG